MVVVVSLWLLRCGSAFICWGLRLLLLLLLLLQL